MSIYCMLIIAFQLLGIGICIGEEDSKTMIGGLISLVALTPIYGRILGVW